MHLLASVRDAAQLASFMSFVNGNIAREVGRLHGWRERFWGRRYRAIVVADETAQIDRLRYILGNGVKEGLVPTPRDWPGCSSVAALTTGAKLIGTWYDRSSEYRARRRGETVKRTDFQTSYPIALSPLPCWRHLAVQDHRKACAELVTSIEADARFARIESGRAFRGMRDILTVNPHDLPTHVDKSPAPFVHASSALVRRAFKAAYSAFVDAFRAAAAALRRGAEDVQFPLAAFPPALPFIAAPPAAAG